MPCPGCAISTCGSFWKIAATGTIGTFCSTASKLCSVFALMKKSILPTVKQDAVVHVRTALHDRHVEPVLAIGAVGERLIEAAVLALRDPVGAEGDLVERLGGGKRPGECCERIAPGSIPRLCRSRTRLIRSSSAHKGACADCERNSLQCAHIALRRHARACRGHPRLPSFGPPKTWMAGTSPGHDVNLKATLLRLNWATARTAR